MSGDWMTKKEFEAKLRKIGKEQYHDWIAD